jgi:hypothetical protein
MGGWWLAISSACMVEQLLQARFMKVNLKCF